MTQLEIHVNNSTVDSPLGTEGVVWTQVSPNTDIIVFSNGSDVVKDGEPIPSSSALNRAGVVIGETDKIIPYCFLADSSTNLLKEVHNAGNKNKRYVFAFSFDGMTASEPILEVWDNTNMNSIDSYCLGAGDAFNSWIQGITTTDALPGNNWVGSYIAGSSNGHFLWLNAGHGELTGAKVLYCNLKITVPANFGNAGAEAPVFVVKYATN